MSYFYSGISHAELYDFYITEMTDLYAHDRVCHIFIDQNYDPFAKLQSNIDSFRLKVSNINMYDISELPRLRHGVDREIDHIFLHLFCLNKYCKWIPESANFYDFKKYIIKNSERYIDNNSHIYHITKKNNWAEDPTRYTYSSYFERDIVSLVMQLVNIREDLEGIIKEKQADIENKSSCEIDESGNEYWMETLSLYKMKRDKDPTVVANDKETFIQYKFYEPKKRKYGPTFMDALGKEGDSDDSERWNETGYDFE